MTFLSPMGRLEIARRIAVLALLSAAIALADSATARLIALALACTAYLWPGPGCPAGTLRMSRVQAVLLPDLLGFALIGFFFGLPFLIGGGDLHPSAWLLWPMAGLFTALPLLAAAASAFGLRLDEQGAEIDSWRRRARLDWGDIASAAPHRRGLPAWLRRLAPFLAAGNPTVAGAVLLARDSTGTALMTLDGRRFVIPREGFERGHAALLRALAAHGPARHLPLTRQDKADGKGASK